MSLRKKSIRLMAALGWQRTRGQKSKGQGILENRNSQAKTDIFETTVNNVEIPTCRATILRIPEPRTAAQYSQSQRGRIVMRIIPLPTTSILWRILIVVIIVFAPFPNISVHIIQSPIIRLFLSYWIGFYI